MSKARPKAVVTATWAGGRKFVHYDAFGHQVVTDAPTPERDSFDGFKPAQLLLVALAGCTGIDVVDILKKMRQDVSGLEVAVTGQQESEPPWPYREIQVQYTVRGCNVQENAVRRAIELSETKYCSVSATVSGKARIVSSFTIVEEKVA